MKAGFFIVIDTDPILAKHFNRINLAYSTKGTWAELFNTENHIRLAAFREKAVARFERCVGKKVATMFNMDHTAAWTIRRVGHQTLIMIRVPNEWSNS